MLSFSKANAKTRELANIPELKQWLSNGRKIYSFDILSGWSCPYAHDCLSKVHRINGRSTILDGDSTKYRCFSASQEALYPSVYNQRKANYDEIKGCESVGHMSSMLDDSLPSDIGICRIHVGGDFFNSNYFQAWLCVAIVNPDILFYTYTKSIPFWIKYKKTVDKQPNFVLTASRGGRKDDLIDKHQLRQVRVCYFETFQQAKLSGMAYKPEHVAEHWGLPIDHDDSHAAVPEWANQDFILLIHGIQPKGSLAAKGKSILKGKGSYTRKAKV